MSVSVIESNCLTTLREMPSASVQCCVTSPPYFGLRDYGHDGQIGLEGTPAAYVAKLVEVFDEVRRVLKDDGTLWLNLGDSYAGSWGSQGRQGNSGQMAGRAVVDARQNSKIQAARLESGAYPAKVVNTGSIPAGSGLKPKDLIGIPWRVAFALQDAGWYLRQDCIWHKPNPMPESVKDRCTKAHEYVFLFSKSERYYFDGDAIAEDAVEPRGPGNINPQSVDGERSGHNANIRGSLHKIGPRAKRNRRSVWTITTKPFKGAHFATFPPELPEICIKAGTRPGNTVLDPFGGAGTTGLVADRLGRNAVLCELNPDYAVMARARISSENSLFADAVSA